MRPQQCHRCFFDVAPPTKQANFKNIITFSISYAFNAHPNLNKLAKFILPKPLDETSESWFVWLTYCKQVHLKGVAIREVRPVKRRALLSSLCLAHRRHTL
jgi:hypothetical protein